MAADGGPSAAQAVPRKPRRRSDCVSGRDRSILLRLAEKSHIYMMYIKEKNEKN
jgi:hypothetical protein